MAVGETAGQPVLGVCGGLPRLRPVADARPGSEKTAKVQRRKATTDPANGAEDAPASHCWEGDPEAPRVVPREERSSAARVSTHEDPALPRRRGVGTTDADAARSSRKVQRGR